jgi:hypothetical protein
VEGPIAGAAWMRAACAIDRRRLRSTHRGYEAGVAAGRAEMQARIAEVQARVTRLDSILKLLARPLEELDAASSRNCCAPCPHDRPAPAATRTQQPILRRSSPSSANR